MTEEYPYMPVVRLPKSKSTMGGPNTQDMLPISMNDPKDYLVSDTLYIEGLPHIVRDTDIRTLLQHCMPIEIQINEGGDGYLRFTEVKYADKAYSLYNGFKFTNGAKLQFRMYQDRSLEPEPKGQVLQVQQLPSDFTDNTLYDMVRSFGPLSLCQVNMENFMSTGTAYIQFFSPQDSEEAQKHLNGGLINGNSLTVTPLSSATTYKSNKFNTNNTECEKNDCGYVDYMNLYIKNLDPTITNATLSLLFRKFGRIVSARVMHNPATGQSKGYGFVSYGKAEEAAAALHEMQGQMVATKPLVVAYHEPKKGRQEKAEKRPIREGGGAYERTTEYNHLPPRYPRASPDSHEEMLNNELEGGHTDHMFINNPSVEQRQPPSIHLPQRKASPNNGLDRSAVEAHARISPQIPFSPNSGTSTGPSLASLASGLTVQPPPLPSTRQERPTFRRRESTESMNSVMTEFSADVQRHKIAEAVLRCGDYGNHVMDIVDMLLTLKRKERSLCLFNQDFLRQKIKLAQESLEIFDDESESEDEVVVVDIRKEHQQEPTVLRKTRPQSILPPRRISKAIPIVSPTPEIQQPSESNAPENLVLDDEIAKLLKNLQDRPPLQQKQLFGDRLFPLVKATGTKLAPKVTIRLLDTVELHELARMMNDPSALKKQAGIAYASLKKQ
ncbi:hypothetical protein DFQ28_007184 [Apophysomyces sp. BC1034]|nr:hypothetical protein DFQ30_007073 [Apophysomyces sp. BC1015]KAG0173689.1 hypothetical protein DFQ29_007861 [Apophysomyces sp. BC1021]KAG0186876.1 hypothetical protein DFQ28_007184 [Apophysomyces sp. BC1034]